MRDFSISLDHMLNWSSSSMHVEFERRSAVVNHFPVLWSSLLKCCVLTVFLIIDFGLAERA